MNFNGQTFIGSLYDHCWFQTKPQKSCFKPDDHHVLTLTVVTKHSDIKLWFKTESLYLSLNPNSCENRFLAIRIKVWFQTKVLTKDKVTHCREYNQTY